MKFSQKTEYSLHALIYLAKKEKAVLVNDIAERLKVSESYLAKVLQELSGAGYLQGFLGPGGDYNLARPPAEITAAEVVKLFEKEKTVLECNHKERGCNLIPDCLILTTFEEWLQKTLDNLEKITIKDFISSNLKPDKFKEDSKQNFG